MKLEKWARTAEIAGNFAVVATVVVLILEVRENTLALERRARMERVARISEPYLSVPEIPAIHARIKAVDGYEDEGFVVALTERYELPPEDAVRWARHLYSIWAGLESDYLTYGPSNHLENQILDLLGYPDNELFWEHRDEYLSARFASYVEGLVVGDP